MLITVTGASGRTGSHVVGWPPAGRTGRASGGAYRGQGRTVAQPGRRGGGRRPRHRRRRGLARGRRRAHPHRRGLRPEPGSLGRGRPGCDGRPGGRERTLRSATRGAGQLDVRRPPRGGPRVPPRRPAGRRPSPTPPWPTRAWCGRSSAPADCPTTTPTGRVEAGRAVGPRPDQPRRRRRRLPGRAGHRATRLRRHLGGTATWRRRSPGSPTETIVRSAEGGSGADASRGRRDPADGDDDHGDDRDEGRPGAP